MNVGGNIEHALYRHVYLYIYGCFDVFWFFYYHYFIFGWYKKLLIQNLFAKAISIQSTFFFLLFEVLSQKN